jgi:hypothetical protein
MVRDASLRDAPHHEGLTWWRELLPLILRSASKERVAKDEDF